MTPGKLRGGIDKVEEIARAVGLFRERIVNPNYDGALRIAKTSGSYADVWNAYYSKQMFDVLLDDFAILQFSLHGDARDEIRYAYVECPRRIMRFSDFQSMMLAQRAGIDPEEIEYEYELHIESSSYKDGFAPIRYDYSVRDYREGLHPVSHLHIGHENNIRVSASKILEPLSFLFLVLRQCYPKTWIKAIDRPEWAKLSECVRKGLVAVDRKYRNAKDEYEAFLA